MGSDQGAALATRFFKTGEGQYAAGDRFLGIKMPTLRAFARTLGEVGPDVALPLLKSAWHEARTLALLALVRAYEKGDPKTRAMLYKLYLRNIAFINNWDLVDMSAPQIVGAWLSDKPGERRRVLTKLAKSKSIWQRRIAILATYYLIRKGDAAETFRIAKLLMRDEEDLIHKAVGWMLREVGQRVGEDVEEAFLKRFYREMPRTMLRYAIERFSPARRKRYLLGLV
jgi:3-methyladenine DNA glycosylase AlkD